MNRNARLANHSQCALRKVHRSVLVFPHDDSMWNDLLYRVSNLSQSQHRCKIFTVCGCAHRRCTLDADTQHQSCCVLFRWRGDKAIRWRLLPCVCKKPVGCFAIRPAYIQSGLPRLGLNIHPYLCGLLLVFLLVSIHFLQRSRQDRGRIYKQEHFPNFRFPSDIHHAVQVFASLLPV